MKPLSGDADPASTRAADPTMQGLSTAEALLRLRRDGPNLLPQPDRRRWTSILLSVLREPMLLLLIAAAVLYVLLGDARDALLLGFSVSLVVALTLYQEVRSEHALQALRDLSSPRAHVRRDGQVVVIAARDVVVGDLVTVAEGDRVPADARVLTSNDLTLDESLLTGESVPVSHRADADARLAHIFAGTLVVRGHASAVVTAIGANTEMGKIGISLSSLRIEQSPLQREMRVAVMLFALISLASCVLVTGLYVALRGDWLQALLAGITLAMSNIPEEFPVVLTVFLALGAWRMARQHVLVRRPPAIEALGAVTVLCTDKTGTLTENRMALTELHAPDVEPVAPAAASDAESRFLLRTAMLASTVHTHDPMDRAILEAAASASLAPAESATCIQEYPITADLMMYTNVWRIPNRSELIVASKGAPEVVAGLCGLAQSQWREVQWQITDMARRGLRVLGVATTTASSDTLPATAAALRLRWCGLIGMADPVRPSVPAAVAEARAAGIRIIVLTGDHLETARAIAAEAGVSDRPEVVLGTELDTLDETAFAETVRRIDVFARVRPEHKLRLVRALKQSGEVVAMTGDGVNDAPALMAAHVGVAMGERGTDVAREASAIVLLDDNFAAIVRAIRMGRAIYDNIRNAARYIIAVHVPITGMALLPLLIDAPLILLPLHIVFLELIIDPACSIVLEREPEAVDIMSRAPRATQARLIDAAVLVSSMARGLVVLIAVAAIDLYARHLGLPDPQQAALAFSALVAGNLGMLILYRGGRTRLDQRRNFHFNKALWIVVALTTMLLVLITRFQVPGAWFGFAPAPLWSLALAVASPLMALLILNALNRLRVPALAQT